MSVKDIILKYRREVIGIIHVLFISMQSLSPKAIILDHDYIVNSHLINSNFYTLIITNSTLLRLINKRKNNRSKIYDFTLIDKCFPAIMSNEKLRTCRQKLM